MELNKLRNNEKEFEEVIGVQDGRRIVQIEQE